MNKLIFIMPNEEMVKIKIIDLETLYNFVVPNFLIWICLGLQILIWNFLCRVFLFLHSANRVFAECQKNTRGECKKTLGLLCRVFFWHSAKSLPETVNSPRAESSPREGYRAVGEEIVRRALRSAKKRCRWSHSSPRAHRSAQRNARQKGFRRRSSAR